MNGFRTFLLRGNLVELAVAFVMGVAFSAVVTAFVHDIITPILGVFGGQPDFSALTFTINNSNFLYGSFIDAVLSFVAIAAAVYYFVVVPYNRFKTPDAPGAPTKECPYCLTVIPEAATRCASCTSQLGP